MNKPLRYWVRRAVVSFPLWLLLVRESDARLFDNGERVFADHEGMIVWAVVFFLCWSAVDFMVFDFRSYRQTERSQP